MLKIYIDGKEVLINKNATILQACDQAGKIIPRFCYHERLSIAGNCRMCLVEVEKSPKPVASCAMPVMEGMKVFTNTPLVKKAREGVLEFLLVNHPLDCPICDQGGECDLQDQALIYGSDRGRFYEYKRGVEDKNCGPLIKTIMTRCIHCTRCVRFIGEVAGVEDLGTTGRGRDTEIGTYVEKSLTSELSGNIIDLCPVGALTSKPYAFTARSWELKNIETIDVFDSLGCNIRIDTRGSQIMRILPRLNEEINEEWISDKTRFSYDGLNRQRLNSPMIKKKDGTLTTVNWETALKHVLWNIRKFEGGHIKGVFGNLVDAESLYAFKQLINRLGSSNISSTLSFKEVDFRKNYIFEESLVDLESIDSCLLIGTNTRYEASLLNLRLRKNYLYNDFKVASIGSPVNLTFPVKHLGNSLSSLFEILEGKHSFCQTLVKAKKATVIVGESIFERHDGPFLINLLRESFSKFGNKNISVNILHAHSSRVASLDLGLVPGRNSTDDKIKGLYLLGVEELSESLYKEMKNSFVIYQGHHGCKLAQEANVILPGATFTEKNSTFVNLEGRSQHTKFAFLPLTNAREDWTILRALYELLILEQRPMGPTDNLYHINKFTPSTNFKSLYSNITPFFNKDSLETPILSNNQIIEKTNPNVKNCFYIYKTPLKPLFDNFYLTNIISKSSKIMAKCTKFPKSNYLL